MPIEIKHGPAAGVVGMAAYLGGQNNSRIRQEAERARLAEIYMRQRQQVDLMNMRGQYALETQRQKLQQPMIEVPPPVPEDFAGKRQFMARKEANDRARRQGKKTLPYPEVEATFTPSTPVPLQVARERNKGALEVEGLRGQNRMGIQDKRDAAIKERDANKFAHDDDAAAIKNAREGLRDGKLELPEPAKTALAVVDNDRWKLAENKEWTDEQKEIEKRKINARERQILGMARPKAPLDPNDDLKQNFGVTPSGHKMIRGKNGWTELRPEPKPVESPEEKRKFRMQETESTNRRQMADSLDSIFGSLADKEQALREKIGPDNHPLSQERIDELMKAHKYTAADAVQRKLAYLKKSMASAINPDGTPQYTPEEIEQELGQYTWKLNELRGRHAAFGQGKMSLDDEAGNQSPLVNAPAGAAPAAGPAGATPLPTAPTAGPGAGVEPVPTAPTTGPEAGARPLSASPATSPAPQQSGAIPTNPKVQRAIAAAKAGDTDAQQALDKRNIPWR